MKLANVDSSLYISQTLPTIQGEGYKTGVPSFLIRLAYCNLTCPWCDTKYAWNFNNELPGSNVITNLNYKAWIDNINMICHNTYNINNIMLTGGEPLLYLNNPLLLRLINDIEADTFEIETNGLLLNKLLKTDMILESKINLNISPKIDLNCYINKETFKIEMDKLAINIQKVKLVFNCSFKFVYNPFNKSSQKEFKELFNKFGLNPNEIIIMPLTPIKQKEQDKKTYLEYYINTFCLPTLSFCLQNGYTLSPRIHTLLFENCREDF